MKRAAKETHPDLETKASQRNLPWLWNQSQWKKHFGPETRSEETHPDLETWAKEIDFGSGTSILVKETHPDPEN